MSSLRLRSVKEDEKVQFHGVDIKRKYLDGSLKNVRVEFADGSYFEVELGQYSSMYFNVAKPPIEIKSYRVHGKYHDDEDFEKFFNDEYKAKQFKDYASSSDLEIEEVINYEE